MLEALLIGVGLAVLVAGGELLVRGASGLALGLGISPVVVGLTVVAFATSSPELAVSVGATLQGSSDVAVGNVVGSNIYNILLILGIAALIRPLLVRRQLVRFDVPAVIAVSALLWVLARDGTISVAEGGLLVALLIVYIAISLRTGRRAAGTSATDPSIQAPEARSRSRDAMVFLAGLVALVVGAQLLVSGATSIATALGIPELVVGLTIVAIGTSLPELVTSAMAARRGNGDLAVGNVMGSNLFNILGILGLSAIVSGAGLAVPEQVRSFDIPVMTVVAAACLPLLFTGFEIRRWEGTLFVAYAVLYTVYVVLDATGSPLGSPLVQVAIWVLLPITALTLAVVLVREVTRRDGRSPGPSVNADG